MPNRTTNDDAPSTPKSAKGVDNSPNAVASRGNFEGIDSIKDWAGEHLFKSNDDKPVIEFGDRYKKTLLDRYSNSDSDQKKKMKELAQLAKSDRYNHASFGEAYRQMKSKFPRMSREEFHALLLKGSSGPNRQFTLKPYTRAFSRMPDDDGKVMLPVDGEFMTGFGLRK